MPREQRHQKASDVFAATDWFLGPPVSFAKAFPRIASLSVRAKSSGFYGSLGRYGPGDGGVRVYTEHTAGEYIDCQNPVCYNGGFRLGDQLRFMEQAGKTHREWTVSCQGYEGTPKGRKKYRPCDEHWEVVVDVVYARARSP